MGDPATGSDRVGAKAGKGAKVARAEKEGKAAKVARAERVGKGQKALQVQVRTAKDRRA
jgi:hypothetical protein